MLFVGITTAAGAVGAAGAAGVMGAGGARGGTGASRWEYVAGLSGKLKEGL